MEPVQTARRPPGLALWGRVLLGLWLAASPLTAAKAAEVVWDPNPPQEQVTGYIVAFGPLSRHDPEFSSYAHEVDVGPALRFDLGGQQAYPDAAYLSVVAYNGIGLRSDYSQELTLRDAGNGDGSGGGGGGCFLEATRRSSPIR